MLTLASMTMIAHKLVWSKVLLSVLLGFERNGHAQLWAVTDPDEVQQLIIWVRATNGEVIKLQGAVTELQEC